MHQEKVILENKILGGLGHFSGPNLFFWTSVF
jgi:hypothetical protein